MTTNQTATNIGTIKSINVSISDFIFTPLACAALVNEVMKNLLYQRSQIPYPYTWLKNIVTKKRDGLEGGESNPKNFTLNKHYQVVSKAFDSAEHVMSDISKIFTCYGERVKEVIFAIGVTQFSPKEVFRIKISSLANGHIERNHVNDNSKKLPRIFRNIFLESSWMELVLKSLSCSNTYIFLKLSEAVSNETRMETDVFVPCKPLTLSVNVKQTFINLNYIENEKSCCCDTLEIFKDSINVNTPHELDKYVEINQTSIDNAEGNTEFWLQSKILIQGFKDLFINKVSASELW